MKLKTSPSRKVKISLNGLQDDAQHFFFWGVRGGGVKQLHCQPFTKNSQSHISHAYRILFSPKKPSGSPDTPEKKHVSIKQKPEENRGGVHVLPHMG